MREFGFEGQFGGEELEGRTAKTTGHLEGTGEPSKILYPVFSTDRKFEVSGAEDCAKHGLKRRDSSAEDSKSRWHNVDSSIVRSSCSVCT